MRPTKSALTFLALAALASCDHPRDQREQWNTVHVGGLMLPQPLNGVQGDLAILNLPDNRQYRLDLGREGSLIVIFDKRAERPDEILESTKFREVAKLSSREHSELIAAYGITCLQQDGSSLSYRHEGIVVTSARVKTPAGYALVIIYDPDHANEKGLVRELVRTIRTQ